MEQKAREKFINKEFSRELNGYSVTEVNNFIKELWDLASDLDAKNNSLEDEIKNIIAKHQNEITSLQAENLKLKNKK
ncbi:MAG0865 family DivIVA-related protein [Mycoplasmopsis primatum]|uniref:MAG0865 family DivIVA-related protein n=1 Tax=Mycoplasmopsis primatum TaxID=55604 RepID=UPI000495C149|nr:DivIVA domain-containing protein [Mycoplasmopsis primatum]